MTQTTIFTEKQNRILEAAMKLRQAEAFESALQLLLELRDQNPELLYTQIFLGLTYKDLDCPKEAEAAFRKALEIDPENNDALQSMGLFLISKDRLPEAIGYLNRYIRKDPASTAVLEVFVPALIEAQREDEALTVLNEAWVASKDPAVATQYARTLLSLEMIDKARIFFGGGS